MFEHKNVRVSERKSFWAFGPKECEVIVCNVECLLPYLPIFLGGWTFRHLDTEHDIEPDILITENSDGNIYVSKLSNALVFEKFESEFVAGRYLADKLVAIFTARNTDKVCINASSVLVNDRLIVFLGATDVERNTLALHLTATGHRFFGNKNLLVRSINNGVINGISLNIPPKVQFPLPDTVNLKYREFIDAFTEITTCNTAYLKLWDGEAASFMEEKPLRAFFILNANKTKSCEVLPATNTKLFETLLESAQLSDFDKSYFIQHTRFASNEIAGYQLSYSKYADAAKVIVETLCTSL